MSYSATQSTDAPAKINLGLRVLRIRPDGYHDIETGFVAIRWCDRITAGISSSISMSCSDSHLPIDESNLCIQAARVLQNRYGVNSGAHIHLEKQIPFGAGLGGGSSDAATTLRLLSQIWSLDISDSEMLTIAAELGSDVPFFIVGKPAIGRERGQVLSPLRLAPIMEKMWVGVVNPGIHIASKDAYAGVRPREVSGPKIDEILSDHPVDSWRGNLINDFEQSIFQNHPHLALIKNQLYESGAIYASLSGSGSSLYGLFESQQKAVKALAGTGCVSWHGQLVL